MKTTASFITAVFLFACSTSIPRTRLSDKSLRIMVDPDSISAEHYVRIQSALVKSGKFFVVDRSQGFQAVKKELERTHRSEADKYSDRDKYSIYGRLFGVGSVVVAHADCQRKQSWWNQNNWKLECTQFIQLIDSNTAQVIVAVEDKNSSDLSLDMSGVVPSWDGAIEKLVAAYPENYTPAYYTKELQDYQDLAQEAALREKEKMNAQRIPANSQ